MRYRIARRSRCAYISYFISVQKTYLKKVDKEAGIDGSKTYGWNSQGHKWEGALMGIYCGAPLELADFMWERKDKLMGEEKLSLAKPLLLKAIADGEYNPDRIASWTDFINSH